jgi:pimeloyl-ACP methyl ester carboxylesterase
VKATLEPTAVQVTPDVRTPDSPHTGKGHIGLIVAGSLLSGLVAAIVLVGGPLGGSQEHVITGAVLLGFAFGWALLALLSTLFTDQPQRWAVVPAAFMALFGAGLIAFSPDARALSVISWLWPLPVLALVAWIVFRARAALHSHTRRWFLYPVLAMLGLAALGGAYQTVGASLDRSATAMPGQMIDVGGYRLYLHCTGSGSPTVILEAGAAESSAYWGWIAPAVAANTKVCVYDRAGRGFSEAAPAPLDAVGVATALHTLLSRAQVAGPYVLVGHSTGGPYVRTFAARYPDQVAGMVLLDSQPNDAFTKLPDYASTYRIIRPASALFAPLARIGVFRLGSLSSFGSLPPEFRAVERATQSTAELQRGARDEFAKMPAILKQASALTSLGDRPLVVVTAMLDAQSGWLPLQDDMLSLSSNSSHRVLAKTEHLALIEDQTSAATASQAIQDVVTSVRSATPLTRP